MKRLLWVIVTAVVLVAVVTGCDGLRRYDARLVAADCLMHDHPDSALALVQAIEPGSLTRERDRAYRDLLLTQGRYRSYVTATSDSDINRALDYYRRHDGEREKLTRAYIYKGAVMEELGLPDTAMTYYKYAEATAAPDDYFNLGYTNLRIAELYQGVNIPDSIVLSRYWKSRKYLTHSGDTGLMINAIGMQGVFQHDKNVDSAIIYLNQAISLGQAIQSPDRFFYQSKLAGIYFYKGDYRQSLNAATNIINEGRGCCPEDLYYYYAARSYLKLGKVDSAYWVQSLMPNPETCVDSMNYFTLISEFGEATGNLLQQESNARKAENIHRRIIERSPDLEVKTAELNFDADTNKMEAKRETATHFTALIILMLSLMVLTLILLTRWIRKSINHYRSEAERTRQEMENLMTGLEHRIHELEIEAKEREKTLQTTSKNLKTAIKKNKDLERQQHDSHQRISAIIRIRQAAINELYQEIRIKSESTSRSRKSLISLFGLIKDLNDEKKILEVSPKESFWKKMKASVDGEFNGIASFVEQNYPYLTTKDNHLFCLFCADLSPQIIKICMNYSSAITASNYKSTFVKEKLKLDLRFNQFIECYLSGQLDKSV